MALGCRASTSATGYVQTQPTGVQPANPNVTTITAGQVTDTALQTGGCVQASNTGLLSATGISCGSGSGGGTVASIGAMVVDSTNPVVYVTPGQNVESIVAANLPGTTFIFSSGTYSQQNVTPLNNDRFIGSPGVVFDGGQILTGWTGPDGNGNYCVGGQTQIPIILQNNNCAAGYPLCGYSNDTFFNNSPLLFVSTSTFTGLASGQWAWVGSTICIHQNPSGNIVETDIQPTAFAGTANGVTIDALTIKNYGSGAQLGCVGDGGAPNVQVGQNQLINWTVENSDISHCHGRAIYLLDNQLIYHNDLHDNGMESLGGAGSGIQVVGNEIARDGYAGFSSGFECGGAKYVLTNGAKFIGNYFHNSVCGPGLWFDVYNTGDIVEGNQFTSNIGPGIQAEISDNITIQNNNFYENYITPGANAFNFGYNIIIANTGNSLVQNNTITVSSSSAGSDAGISIINQSRGLDANGAPVLATNNTVANNTITLLSGCTFCVAATVATDQSLYLPFSSSPQENRFFNNVYHVPSVSAGVWVQSIYDAQDFFGFSGWQAAGYDVDGTADTNNSGSAVNNFNPITSKNGFYQTSLNAVNNTIYGSDIKSINEANQTVATLGGGTFAAIHNSTNVVTNVYGVKSGVTNNGGGLISNGYGYYESMTSTSAAPNIGASTFTTYTGYYAANPSVGPASLISTNYGIYVATQTAGTINHGIYDNGDLVVVSTITVGGLGNGVVNLTISGQSGYDVTSSSVIPSVGQYAIASSTNGTVVWGSGGGGGGGSPGGSSGQVQWNSAGSFAGVSGSVVTSSSMTLPVTMFTSSVTVGSIASEDNLEPGFLDVFNHNPSAGDGYLFNVGSVNQQDQFRIQDQQPVYMARYGANIGGMLVGGSGGQSLVSGNDSHSLINIWNNGEMDLETTSTGNGGGNIVLLPGETSEVVVSTLGVTISTSVVVTGVSTFKSSMTITAGGGLGVTYGVTMGSATVNGNGNGVINLTISNQTGYDVTSSSVTPIVGNLAVFTSTNGTLGNGGIGGGGGGGSPASPSGSLQYNSAGSFGAVSGSYVTSSSVTLPASVVTSSLTVLDGFVGSSGNFSSILNVYGVGSSAGGQVMASFGTNQGINQVEFIDQEPASYKFGFASSQIGVGNPAVDSYAMYSGSFNQKIDIYNPSSPTGADMDLQTCIGCGNIVLLPGTVPEITVSTLAVTISTSVNINTTNTATSGTSNANTFETLANPASASTAFVYGLLPEAAWLSNSASPSGGIFAINPTAAYLGSGTLGTVQAFQTDAANSGGGSVKNLYGGSTNASTILTSFTTNQISLEIGDNVTGGSTVTFNYGIFVSSMQKDTSSIIKNNYGIYIDSTSGATSNYGIFEVQGNNYFGGTSTFNYGVQAATGTFTTSITAGTTAGSGTQLYRCSGGTDAGWVLYGNTGAAQTLCTSGGGSLVAMSYFAP